MSHWERMKTSYCQWALAGEPEGLGRGAWEGRAQREQSLWKSKFLMFCTPRDHLAPFTAWTESAGTMAETHVLELVSLQDASGCRSH